jgi:hypothetical protein
MVKSTPLMEKALEAFAATGQITERFENNPYLKVSYKGTGITISEKWNVRIYKTGSIVTTDLKTFMDIVEGTYKQPDESLKVIQIDDAGIGFPLCGIMIGVTDGEKIWSDTVSVKFFQGDAYENKLYVKEYTQKGLDILTKIGASSKTHRIEICSGYINQTLKERLRELGYEVTITDIKGLLQDKLEGMFRAHVLEETGKNLGYDPKGLTERQIRLNYYSAVNWGEKFAPALLKTGWKALGGGG